MEGREEMEFSNTVHARAIALGKDIIRMTTAAGSGHPSSALSIIHIVITLMYDVMRWDPSDPRSTGSDRLVLSEGHAVPAIYAAYADLGGLVGKPGQPPRKLQPDDLLQLREADSPLDGHPNPAEGFGFFDAATGSLGQGLSVAAGLALGAKMSGADRRVFTIIGDGESREGQIWEAMDFIAERGLTQVVAIFNCNGQGQADYVSKQQSAESIAVKAAAFGWDARPVDGHDPQALRDLLRAQTLSRPQAIVARTIKGWGCEMLQDHSNHGKPVPEAKLDSALAQLDATAASLGIVHHAAVTPRPPAAGRSFEWPKIPRLDFAAAMNAAGLDAAVSGGKLATRRAYGAALLALAEVDPRIVALDGDVSNSTFAEILGKKHPHRFVECKIAEQNMVSAAVGLAAAGYIPFVSSFAKFLSRAYDQIEMAQITRANVKLVGSHSGISLAADGPSQMSLHDVTYFRSASETDDGCGRPVCVSFHPADAVAAFFCTCLMADHPGMCYMRTHRPDAAILYKPDTSFEIGGSHVLSTGDALTIVSAGYMVHVCKQAVDSLAAGGIKCTLIDAYSFPLKTDSILAVAAKTGNRILCVEDNYVGGLAGALAEAAARAGSVRVEAMTCSKLPKSAKSTDAIMSYCGLHADDILGRVCDILH
jgi:transketolase